LAEVLRSLSRAEHSLIIEGLLTTTNDLGGPHVAPMGPVVNPELTRWTLRPFASSTTFKLLRERPTAVFHVVDDVLPVVQAALGMQVELNFEQHVSGNWIIADCCHWFLLQVVDWDVSSERSVAHAKVIDRGVKRPFWGWNRAKHAVLEATILATRLHLADRRTIADDLATLKKAVEKTAGEREWTAWNLVLEFVDRSA
jgi:uncharacterized protein